MEQKKYQSPVLLYIDVYKRQPMSRAVVSERYGKAHYLYSYAGVGEKIHHQDSVEDVVSDYHFSQITKKGQAIISMPGISSHPFLYDGYRKEKFSDA